MLPGAFAIGLEFRLVTIVLGGTAAFHTCSGMGGGTFFVPVTFFTIFCLIMSIKIAKK
jgi:hypothetical protein